MKRIKTTLAEGQTKEYLGSGNEFDFIITKQGANLKLYIAATLTAEVTYSVLAITVVLIKIQKAVNI